jgi:hypothetical protein
LTSLLRPGPFKGIPTANESSSSTALGFPSWRVLSFGFFKDPDSNFAPSPYLSVAVGASDQAVIGRMIWDDEFIAATLMAPEGGSGRVRLDRLRHDTASILVGRITAGEECGGKSILKTAFVKANRRELCL